MKLDLDEFLILLLRQLEGYTNWTEDRHIERILRAHPEACRLQEDMLETFPQQPFSDNRQAASPRPALGPARVRRLRNIAAALLVFVITGASLFFFSSRGEQLYASTAPAPEVTLQIAGGEAIRLGDTNRTIPVKDALLSTHSEMLRFTAKTAGDPARYNTLLVPATRLYSITLADGTVVHMNAGSALRFPFAFNSRRREVYVEGEAFFSVAPDAGRPFIVHTPQGDVTVLGTAFNISTYGNRFMLSLVSGSVAIAGRKGAQAVLKPCRAAIMDSGGLLRETDFESEQVLGWLRGQYRFRQQSLREVCNVAERWYGVAIRLDNKELGQLKYSGILSKKEPLDIFLDKLRSNGEVYGYYYDTDGAIVLKTHR
ncbi:FecR family protein [Chitinophaga japonensis]|uniref:FecR family protein n=1 Tax=Chitinophaga japonensis TaxID=104662 RepID=A0A562SZF3_CHIJA|nr:FecR domain-containing protein [Chitinophaga japonensis]TWI86667.1 FecR family protein [Chitinophaga japonensis]